MSEVLVGTASWTDATLIKSGRFYPPQAKTAEARLQYYASQFPLVEIDSTYYALPAERTAQLWVERTPADFVFNVKAFRLFTGHPAQPSALPADLRRALPPTDKSNFYLRDLAEEIRAELWRRFRLGLEPLRQSGKLGVVLLQFAPWFVFGRESFEHIVRCAEMLEGFRLAVEFRNKSWFGDRTRDRTISFERDHGLVHVVVDEPQGFASSCSTTATRTRRSATRRSSGRSLPALLGNRGMDGVPLTRESPPRRDVRHPPRSASASSAGPSGVPPTDST
jgi:uncharacterized protein YecE (DUF72 family)